MATLADAIEAYLKQLIRAQSGYVEFRRCDLADSFACAPSQINYVLETRFSTEHGYIVESRRGGGGYIRIQRVRIEHPTSVFGTVCDMIGSEVGEEQALRLLNRLTEAGCISERRAGQIRIFLTRQTAGLRPPLSDFVRASVLKGMLYMLLVNPEDVSDESPLSP